MQTHRQQMQTDERPSKITTLHQLKELAEIGRNARIIFHDLSNHLTALTLSMEHVTQILKSHIQKSDDPSFFNPVTETHKTLSIFRDATDHHMIDVRVRAAEHHMIFGSKVSFTHIMTNLITNAIEACVDTPFEPHLITTARHIIVISFEKKVSGTVLTVSDNGSGIAKKHLHHIFNESYTTKKTGHGIGLFSVRKYVEESFCGTIRVRSICTGPSRGTTFTIEFPEWKQSSESHQNP